MLVFSPAILLAFLIDRNAVSIPVWDGWERIALFEGPLTWKELYAPHIDHRMVFPRLLILGLGHLGDGDLRWENAATLLFGLAAGIGIRKLALDTVGGIWGGWLTFLCNLWIFSPLQYDNWLWAYQTAFMIPMACLAWAIWATIRPWVWWKRFLPAAALAIVGTHSFSHGLFIWPAIFLLGLLLPGFEGRWRFAGLWLALGTVIITCYFGIDFKPESRYSYGLTDHTPLVESVQRKPAFDKLSTFFLTTLGGPAVRQFAVDPFPSGRFFGGLLLASYLVCGAWVLFRLWIRKDRDLMARALPWLALGGSVIAIAAGISAGRTGILAQARSAVPRFLSVSLYLPIAVLAIGVLMTRILHPRGQFEIFITRLRGKSVWLAPGLMGFFIALQVQPWLYGARLMELWRVSRQQAQAQVRFIEHFPPQPIRLLAYDLETVRANAPKYDARGWLDPPLVKSLDLDQFSQSDRPLPPSKGVIRKVRPDRNPGSWALQGTSQFRSPIRPADAVLLTAEHPGLDSPRIIGLADFAGTRLPTRYRIDLQFTVLKEHLALEPGTWTNWSEVITTDGLPPERPLKIRAWCYLVSANRVYPCANHAILESDGELRLVED